MATPSDDDPRGTKAEASPRKVRVATVLNLFTGCLDERLARAERLIDDAACEADRRYAGRGLDLVVLPEYALVNDSAASSARGQAVRLEGRVLDLFAREAREHHTHLLATMVLDEGDCVSNAAVLFDRAGDIAGIYRKVHPVSAPGGELEGGTTPGTDYPVFPCDFGRLGVLICYDMNYDDAWDALARGGAELVALPSDSPQTLRPLSRALRHRFYVVTATPRDNASIFNPIGLTVAQATSPGVLVHELDLSFAILHWSEPLEEGAALRRAYGDAVGFDYSRREDTGVFWSNDPDTTIGDMLRRLGLEEMQAQLRRCRDEREAAVSRDPRWKGE